MSSLRRSLPRYTGAALAGLALALSASPAAAQYFGRNKVQYRTFDFQVMKTPHFDIYYYPEEEQASRDAARMAERWYARLSVILDHDFDQRQPIVLYGSSPAFQQTTTLQGSIGEGTGGVTEALKQRVILPLTGSYQETDHVLGHELVHAFQYDISGLGRSGGTLGVGARALATAPLWFIEGMAEYFSKGPVDPLTAMWMRDAVLTGDLPTVDQLTNDPNYFPYRWGQALWAYVGGRWGDATIGQILSLIGQGVPYPDAFQRVLNIDLDNLFEDWHVAIRRAYLPLLAEHPEAREVAKPLITSNKEGGELNVGPSISPDGKYVAFLSELDLDVELWLADAHTGEVLRRLQKGTAFDPHFQSLRFINSAGTWSPDSKQFAFSALRDGHDELVILNVENGDILRETAIPDVIEIATPTWSPDGRTIVFAGITGGISDLYAYNVASQATTRLTNDRYAEMHPAFSPDGSTLAFVTDRGPGTDLDRLTYGGYQLALMDATGGEVRLVPGTNVGESINPSWTRDGTGLYFISNRTGIPNIYRVNLADDSLFQITKLFGGVSGITDTSPALTVARSEDRLLFTAYERGGYNIYALTSERDLAGTPAAAPDNSELAGDPLAAQLPPAPRPEQTPFTRVYSMLHDMSTGLETPQTASAWPVGGYHARLALDYLGQPQFGVSVGGVAGQGGLYGGISANFSDILGYHRLMGIVAAQGQFDEIGFQTLYLNQKNRWNWGVGAQRIPYIALGQRLQYDPDTGILSNQILRRRYFDTGLSALTQYPFSSVKRLEFSAGLTRLSTDIQVFEISGPAIVDAAGNIISYIPQSQRQYKLEGSGKAWNTAEASAALVYDNALFGYTSPFAGQRYRFQLTPTVGSLDYVEALADFRHYFFLQPFTLAVQGLHFGRYGRDADNPEVFYPVFLGQPSLVRGYYSVYSDCYSGCSPTDADVFNLVFGSRIAVAKAELRFPLIRALVIGPIGFPPIEGFGFLDGGVAWDNGSKPVFARGLQPGNDRGAITSGGVGARINLLGFAVLEVDYVNAFERKDGWHWQFALQPGF